MARAKVRKIEEIVAENVRHYRNLASKSQEELAGDAEISRTYMGEIERAEKIISITVLAQLARALGVKPADLVTPADH